MKKSEEFLRREKEERNSEIRRRYVAERTWEKLMKKIKPVEPYFNPDTQQVMWGTNRQDFLSSVQKH